MSLPAVALAALLAPACKARALDKQGSGSHGGSVEAPAEDAFNVSGALWLGVSMHNPTYAARPDNSGHTLMRYAGHADLARAPSRRRRSTSSPA